MAALTPQSSVAHPTQARHHRRSPLKTLHRLLLAVVLACSLITTASAGDSAPQASAGSSLAVSLPVAASATAAGVLFSAGAELTLTAVEASATGTVWVLERAADGASTAIEFSGEAIAGSAVAVGTAMTVTEVAPSVRTALSVF